MAVVDQKDTKYVFDFLIKNPVWNFPEAITAGRSRFRRVSLHTHEEERRDAISRRDHFVKSGCPSN